MNIGFLFPGQGSQFVGMGYELAESFPEAKEVFNQVDDALDFCLSRIIFNGPIEANCKYSAGVDGCQSRYF